MRQKLPTIAIPLKKGDGDAALDLQNVFDTVYDRAGYDLSVNYQRELGTAMDEATGAWIKEIVAQ